MAEAFWRLTIGDSRGQCAEVFGTEEVLAATYSDWLEHPDAIGDSNKIIEVCGFHNTMDRAESRYAILRDEVVSMSLSKMY